MAKVTVLTEVPIIMTKDLNWASTKGSNLKLVPGAIMILPEDAVLLIAPQEEKDGQ